MLAKWLAKTFPAKPPLLAEAQKAMQPLFGDHWQNENVMVSLLLQQALNIFIFSSTFLHLCKEKLQSKKFKHTSQGSGSGA